MESLVSISDTGKPHGAPLKEEWERVRDVGDKRCPGELLKPSIA
jgi:hypothetical protein